MSNKPNESKGHTNDGIKAFDDMVDQPLTDAAEEVTIEDLGERNNDLTQVNEGLVEEISKLGEIIDGLSEEVPDEIVTAEEEREPRKIPDWEIREDAILDVEPKDSRKGVYFPSGFQDDVQTTFDDVVDLDLKETPDNILWAEALTQGLKTTPKNNAFLAAIQDGAWTNKVLSDGALLGTDKQRLTNLSKVKVSGQEAKTRAQIYMGGGDYYSVACWASGIWLKLRPIGELEILELYREIVRTKIDLGYYTYGAVYSQTSAYTVESIVKFIIKNLSTSSYKYSNADDLLEVLKITDLQELLAALNSSLYNDELQHTTACTANPEKCTHTYTGTISISKRQGVKVSALPDRVRTFMTKTRLASRSVTKEMLDGYEAELLIKKSDVITINLPGDKVVKLVLKIPSIADYIRGAHSWIDGLKEMIEEGVVKPKDDEERNSFISEAASASSLRQYSHYIDHIIFGDEVEVHEADDIEDILTTYTRSDEIRSTMVESIQDFINSVTLSVVGIPTSECEKCGERNGAEGEIIPLDQLEVFINLLGVKCREIRNRDQ